MKNIQISMLVCALSALSANATISYVEDDLFGDYIQVTGEGNNASAIVSCVPQGKNLEDAELYVNEGTINMDAPLSIRTAYFSDCTLVFDNQLDTGAPVVVLDSPYDDFGMAQIEPMTITFAPTKSWENYFSCKLLGSAEGSYYQIWGDGEFSDAKLQEYLASFNFVLAGLAEGLTLQTETGFVASMEDVTPGHVGIVLDGYKAYGTSLAITGLTLVANVSSVPEPATGSLSLLALAGLCARRRRK